MAARYLVIVKIRRKSSQQDDFIKLHSNNLLSLVRHLEKNYDAWRYMNVFRYTKNHDGSQLAAYTKKNPPRSRFVETDQSRNKV